MPLETAAKRGKDFRRSRKGLCVAGGPARGAAVPALRSVRRVRGLRRHLREEGLSPARERGSRRERACGQGILVVDAGSRGPRARGRSARRRSRSGRSARWTRTLCVGCGRCAEICGYRAVQVEARPGGRFVARVDELACKGCGTCVAVCPTGAIDQRNFEHESVMKRLEGVSSSRAKVLFVCHWARPERLDLPRDVLVIETMCAGRVPPQFILEAVLRGSPRVLVCGLRRRGLPLRIRPLVRASASSSSADRCSGCSDSGARS